MPWHEARAAARGAIRELPTATASVDDCVGSVLTDELTALADMPAYDTALIDGWAFSGTGLGPWTVKQADRKDLFSGLEYHEPGAKVMLRAGQAVHVYASQPLGDGVTGVLPENLVRLDGDLIHLAEGRTHVSEFSRQSNPTAAGTGVRPRGIDAGAHATLLPAGTVITPPVAALAAAAGHDQITVIPPPQVALVRVGDAALDRGIPRSGLARDTVFPALPGWVQGLRAQTYPARWVNDGDLSLMDEIDDLLCDIVITSGPSTGASIRRILHGLDAEILVDGVDCRPGDSMLLARLSDGRPLIHCGGSAQDALATLLTLLAPMIATASGQPDPMIQVKLNDATVGDRYRTTLIPVSAGKKGVNSGAGVSIVTPGGPGGLLAMTEASGLAVIPPGGVRAFNYVSILPVPGI